MVAPHVSAAAAQQPAARPERAAASGLHRHRAPAVLRSGAAAHPGGRLRRLRRPDRLRRRPAPWGGAGAAAPAGTGAHAAQLAGDVEELDGTRALEVQALFRGVVVNTRHLFDPGAKALSGQARGMLAGGIFAILVAFVVFVYTVIDVGGEKIAFDAHIAANKEARAFNWKPRSPAVDAVVFLGLALGLGLVYMGLKRRHEKHHDYIIGADPNADAPGGQRVHRRSGPRPGQGLGPRAGRQRDPGDDRRGQPRRRPGDPAAPVRAAARAELLAARARPRPHRRRRDNLPHHLDAPAARARDALPDLEVERAGLHGGIGGGHPAVPADDLLGAARSQVAVARSRSTPTTAS